MTHTDYSGLAVFFGSLTLGFVVMAGIAAACINEVDRERLRLYGWVLFTFLIFSILGALATAFTITGGK